MYGEETVVEIRISPRQAKELADRLVDDADFRERLAQNPNAELSQYGINIPPVLLPERVELPSPDELRQARDAIVVDEFGDDYGNIGKFLPIFCAVLYFGKMRPRS
jgi:putative modified peptide